MIVASIASLSSCAELLERTIASLEPQVDAFCVYLNGYGRVPDFLRRDKVLHAILSCEAGWRGAEAKLWFWDADEFKAAPHWKSDDVALVCDDDLLYPPDYARRMIGALDARPGSVACVHGSILGSPFERYAVSRLVARTTSSLGATTQVHVPGTGTTAFRYGDVCRALRGSQRRFTWSHSVDPHAAVIFHEAKIPIWSVLRPARWIVSQPLPSAGTAIFASRTGAGVDANETRLLKDAGERMAWPDLVVPKDMTPRVLEVSRGAIDPPAARGKSKVQPPQPNPHSMLPHEAILMIVTKFGELAAGAVVELGSGFGTQHLLDAMPPRLTLISVEHDQAFVGLVPDASYIHAPIHNGWYDVRSLRAKLPPVDTMRLVIVDGPPGKIGRARLAKNLDLFPAKVPMLIDDVHRAAELEMARQIAKVRGEQLVIHRCPGRAFATLGW